MENIIVRPIEEEDYRFINKWWKDATGKNPPKRKLLPENGLHGLMGGVSVVSVFKIFCI